MDAKKISRTSGELAMSEKRSSNGGEVVISVLSEETPRASTEIKETKETASSTAEFAKSVPMSSPSPEISRFSTSPNKPPKIPTSTNDTPTRKKSLGRSVYSKPKSRFGEQPYSVDVDLISSNKFEENTSTSQEQISRNSSHRNSLNRESSNNKLANSNKTVSAREPEDDDEEEEIYKIIELNNKKHGRVKIKNLVEWFAFACVLGCLVASLTVDDLKKSMFWGLEMWKWCVLVMVIFFGLSVTKRFMKFIVFLIEKNFLFKKKVLYFVHGLKKSVQVFIWFALVLSTWVLLFKYGVERSETATKILNFITWTLVSLLIGSFLLLVKILLRKILTFNYHVKTFFDRIQESVFHQLILQTLLSEPRYTEEAQKVGRKPSIGNLSITRTKKGKENEKKVIDMARLHKLKQEKISAWAMEGMADVVMISGLSTISNMVDESVAEGGDEQTEKEITKEMEPAYTAHRIFKNVAQPDCPYIEENDLLKFMIQEWVDYFFSLFGGIKTEKIDKKALRVWVVKVYDDRKALALALNDTKTGVKQMNKLVTWILIVVTIIVWLLLTEIATTKVILLLSTQLVAAVFIFGNTCKTIFEGIIFVFVMHPFDVGDRCVIDGVQLDKEKVYYPNSVLATKPIGNYYRSSDMGDDVEFSIDFPTPVEKIRMLKKKNQGLVSFCSDRALGLRLKIYWKYLNNNSKHWKSNHTLVVKEIEDVNKIKMALYCNHTMNFQDLTERNKRRTKLVIQIMKFFEEINIKYNLLPQKVHLSQLGSESTSLTN